MSILHTFHPGRGWRLAAIALLVILLQPAAALAIKIRLRNDLNEGALAVYDVTIRGERTTPSLAYEETIRFTQTGRLVLLVLDQPDRYTARRAWMMDLGLPQDVTVLRDGAPVADPPSAKALGLPPKAAQLMISPINSERAPASPVGGSRVQRAGLMLALDFAQWPDRVLAEGETWETPADRPELAGTWTHTYTQMSGRGADRMAKGTFSFAGELAGDYAGAARIRDVQGTWTWRVAKRALAEATATVTLAYGPDDAPRTLTMEVTLDLARQKRLESDALTAARAQLAELDKLSQALNAGDPAAQSGLEQFVKDHPQSLWLPVAQGLADRQAFESATLDELTEEQVLATLTKVIRAWHGAEAQGKVELLAPLRATLEELMEAQGPMLRRLSSTGDPNVRAMATFCVAFGGDEQDRLLVEKAAGDDEIVVRLWAAYGLAQRRDTAVPGELIVALLEDQDPRVRQRACEAAATCVAEDAAHRDAVFRRLVRLVTEDDNESVKNRAAAAIEALATPADLPVLIETEAKVELPFARRQLEATIRRLGGEPKRP